MLTLVTVLFNGKVAFEACGTPDSLIKMYVQNLDGHPKQRLVESLSSYNCRIFSIVISTSASYTVSLHVVHTNTSAEAVTAFRPLFGTSLCACCEVHPQIHLVTFCGCQFKQRIPSFFEEATATPFFDMVHIYSEVDLPNELLYASPTLFSTLIRGCGHWIYKPFIAIDVMKLLTDGDVLVYADCGCTFNGTSASEFNHLIDLALKSPGGTFAYALPDDERVWTKADIFEALNVTGMSSITHTNHLMATIWFAAKSEWMIVLLQNWAKLMALDDYSLVDDSPSRVANDKLFRENRHDQSIFSVLRKIHNVTKIPDNTYRNPFAPIQASRCKMAKCTIK